MAVASGLANSHNFTSLTGRVRYQCMYGFIRRQMFMQLCSRVTRVGAMRGVASAGCRAEPPARPMASPGRAPSGNHRELAACVLWTRRGIKRWRLYPIIHAGADSWKGRGLYILSTTNHYYNMIVSVSKRVLPATPTPGENARKCFNINYKMPGEKVGWRSTEPDEESRDLDPSLGSSFCFTPSHSSQLVPVCRCHPKTNTCDTGRRNLGRSNQIIRGWQHR